MDWLAKHVQKIHVDKALAERNFECLVSLLRNQDTPSDVRDYLADVVLGLLTGKLKLPAHRPAKGATQVADERRGRLVWTLRKQKEWQKTSAAVKRAAELEGCSEDTIWKSWRRFDKAKQFIREEDAAYDAMMDSYYEARNEAALYYLKSEEGERDFTDEEIKAAAEIVEENWSRDHEAWEAYEMGPDDN